MTKKTEKQVEKEKMYSKQAFIDAENDSKERLLLKTLLTDKRYTKKEVQKIISDWKKKGVKK